MSQISAVSTTIKQNIKQDTELKPMPVVVSALIFGIAGLIMVLSFYIGIPLMEQAGISPLESFLVAIGIPSALMFTAAIVGYAKVEGHPLTRKAFAARMWYGKFRFRDVLIGIGVYIASGAAVALLTVGRQALVRAGLVPLPANIPLFINPLVEISRQTMDQAAGGSLVGRWDIVAVYTVVLFFMVVGEELLWRGFILPRQELVHGKWTWIIHGLLWTIFHTFKYWDMIVILPVCLGIAYVSYRLKSNWAALIIHTLGNLSFYLLAIGGVMGVL